MHKLPANFNIFDAKQPPQLRKVIEMKLEKKPICRHARACGNILTLFVGKGQRPHVYEGRARARARARALSMCAIQCVYRVHIGCIYCAYRVKKLFQFFDFFKLIFRARAHIASKTFSFPSLKTSICRKISYKSSQKTQKTAVFSKSLC